MLHLWPPVFIEWKLPCVAMIDAFGVEWNERWDPGKQGSVCDNFKGDACVFNGPILFSISTNRCFFLSKGVLIGPIKVTSGERTLTVLQILGAVGF